MSSIGEETLALHMNAYRIDYKREQSLIPGRRWRWDFVVGDIAIEVHGQVWRKGAHSTGAGITRDLSKINALTLAGYRILCFTTQMVESGEAIDCIRKAIGAATTKSDACPIQPQSQRR